MYCNRYKIHCVSISKYSIIYAGEWLICGSVSLCLFSIGVIQFTIASASHNDHEDGEDSSNNRSNSSSRHTVIDVVLEVERF